MNEYVENIINALKQPSSENMAMTIVNELRRPYRDANSFSLVNDINRYTPFTLVQPNNINSLGLTLAKPMPQANYIRYVNNIQRDNPEKYAAIANARMRQAQIPGAAIDPMQALSAANAL